MILHGESTDYDTEQNSLKAWSFLYYVGNNLKYEELEKVRESEFYFRLFDSTDEE